MRNPFWLNRIKAEGVKLVVEINLTFEQFRRLLERGFGSTMDDDAVIKYWEITNRRILPPEPGSFSGIGGDVNDIIHEALK